ncbi:PaaI family thioesterase [Endozoicomonadaceae bacterium StTr2]
MRCFKRFTIIVMLALISVPAEAGVNNLLRQFAKPRWSATTARLLRPNVSPVPIARSTRSPSSPFVSPYIKPELAVGAQSHLLRNPVLYGTVPFYFQQTSGFHTFPFLSAQRHDDKRCRKDDTQVFLDSEYAGANIVIERAGMHNADIRIPVTDKDIRPGGGVAGPFMMAVTDAALYSALFARFGTVDLANTLSMNIDFLRKASEEKRVLASCELLEVDKILALGGVTLFSEGEPEPVAHATCRYLIPPAEMGQSEDSYEELTGSQPPVFSRRKLPVNNNPEMREHVQSFYTQVLGEGRLTVECIASKRADIRVPFASNRDLRSGGVVSTPFLVSIADIALFTAIFGETGDYPIAYTVSLNINSTRKPLPGADVLASCYLLRVGKSLVTGEIILYSDGDDRPIAHVKSTYSVVTLK